MKNTAVKNVWLSWSTGKDSVYTLGALRRQKGIRVTGLFTTITETFNRVSMHATREGLLDAQARRLGLPLHKVSIPSPCPNETYEARINALIIRALGMKVDAMAFGDLFLEDVRNYRLRQFEKTAIEPLFPLWGLDTRQLAERMLELGFKAIVTCVDEKKLHPGFSGRAFTGEFLRALPPGVDPCGENGEFHTFVHDCPLFSSPIAVTTGERVSRGGFTFTDVLPAAD